MQYLAKIDGHPVLYRQLTDVYPVCTRLSVNRVGIVANWEWGNDTGSVFRDFVARGYPIGNSAQAIALHS
jgi:hypothetical protein